MRTEDGRIVTITTRYDAIRIGVRDRDGTRTWEVFTVPDIKALEGAMKAARDKIARKRAKRTTR